MYIKSIIVLVLITLNSFAQVEKIRVKKENVATKKPIVTIAGTHAGEISLTKLCSDKKFKISNNTDSLKVEFGIIRFTTTEGNLTEWVNSYDSLNTSFLQYLLGPRSAAKTKVTIYRIKGKNSKGKEVKLNDITLTVIK
jgi:hypothetical protein